MNRLIIIGNGFDLAHGMPTSYSDFVKWYLTLVFKKLAKNGIYNDEAINATIAIGNDNRSTLFLEEIIKSIEDNDIYNRENIQKLLNNQLPIF